MKKTFKYSIALIMMLGFYSSIFAQKSLDKKVLMSIGDEDVTIADFMKTYTKNNNPEEMNKEGAIDEYLDLYVNFKLKVKEAKTLKMDTIRSFVRELEGYRKQLAKPYFIDESVNEALLKEAYERKLKDLRASHILIMVDKNATPSDTLAAYKKIMKIRDEIVAGKDFAEAAIEYSDDPSARDQKAIPNKQRFRKGNKGDLGYFTVFNMVYPFESAAYNTPVGEVSQPIRTQFGYHLLKLDSKTDALGVAQVAHVYVSLRPNASSEDSARKAEKINNIYAKIQGGMSFEDAVVKYSEDKGSAKNKGQLSKFTCNKVVPEFVDIAKQLKPGEVSEPIHTIYGFHIVKLLSRKTPGTFEEEKDALKERLAKDNRTHKSEDAVLNKIKEDSKFKIYQKQKDQVFAIIDSTVLDGKFNADSIAPLTKILFKIAKEKHSQADFIAYVADKQKKQENMDRLVYLNNLFNDFTKQELLAYADRHLEENYPEFGDLMQEYHDGILLFNLTDEMVWNKAVKDTIGQKEFFDKHRGDYMWGERVEATVFRMRKPDEVEKAMSIIAQYDNDGDIAKTLDADSIKSVRIIPDVFEKGQNKFVDKVEWKVGLSDLVKSDVENLVVAVKIKKVIPPQQKELKEARGIVTADYQNYLEKEWIKQLKEKYTVNINEEVLQALKQSQQLQNTNK
jgi:peptidyl-prolyl cis-trans isomerase SurA